MNAFPKPQTPDEIIKIAELRSRVFATIRNFFDRQAFIEIDAPILLNANAVETQIDPLCTLVHPVRQGNPARKFLMTSPELHMKRLLAHGLPRIYHLGHVFRDREFSPIHQNEFTMLEWYEANSTLDHIILQSESLFSLIAIAINGTGYVSSKDHTIDFSQGFDRLSMAQAWETFAGIDLLGNLEAIAAGHKDALSDSVRSSGENLRDNADFEDAFTHIMLKMIEPKIGKTRPCILFDWPTQTAALARTHPDNPLLAQRFEIYCDGVELGNAFAELTDSVEQRNRFIESNQVRGDLDKIQLPICEEFLWDLQKMPPSCGIAVGIDRLIGLLCRAKDIREITCFAK